MNEIQSYILEFLDENEKSELNFENLKNSLTSLLSDQQQFKSILKLISNICNNHVRTSNFSSKILQIIQFLKPHMKNITSKSLIDIFKDNILFNYYLIKENILDPTLINQLQNFSYFRPEVTFDTPDDEFEEKRQKGENDSLICEIIRNDSIDEFIEYVNRTNTPLNSQIKKSIFETNPYLLDKTPTLIQYSAFYGSIRIFQYLLLKNIELTQNIWNYSIHGNNAEIIQLLVDQKIYPLGGDYSNCLSYSIKCFNNEISLFFDTEYVKKEDLCILYSFIHHNYYFLSTENKYNEKNFLYSIIYGHLDLFQIFLNNDTDINKKIDGKTPIYYAIQNDQNEIVDAILKDPKFKIINECLKDNDKLIELKIPSTVKFIGDLAFYNCNNFLIVEIPSTVTSIGKHSFYKCISMNRIKIPSSVKYIKSHAFESCSILCEIDMSSCLITTIAKSCFKNCTNLMKIILPSSLTTIESNAFKGCSLHELLIPPSVTKIECSAFADCLWLAKITLPPSITCIQDETFKSCSNLAEILIPSSVTTICCSAFAGCTSLKKIIIPPSVTSIHKTAFKKCFSLTEVQIQSSLKSIKKSTFKMCESLTQISIPSSVTSIKYGAFFGCSELTQISIPSSVTDIGDYAFSECSSLTQIAIPSSVTYIGNSAFSKCSSLTQITIPSSVTLIGNSAFSECSLLKQITIPSTIDKQNLGLKSYTKINTI